MGFIEILTDNGLTQEQWDDKLFTEYIGMLDWKHYMGTSTDAIIQVKEELTKEPGDAITIGIRGRVIGGKVTGNAKLKGNEGTVEFFDQRILVDNVRRGIKFEDVPMSKKRTGFDLLNQGREALDEIFQEDLDDAITDGLTDTLVGRVRGRYLYGGKDSNWNPTHATALQAIDNTDDKLTVDMVSIAKRKALIPVNALTKMRPMRVKTGKDFEQWFCLKIHTYAARDLTTHDAVWRNAQLNIPPGDRDDSPLFKGSAFKGGYDGVLYYEYDRLPLITSTIQVAHNLLLGAQAAAVVWGQRAKFASEDDDYGHDIGYELHEIRGVKKLVFSRSTPEDHGVVNVFSAAMADV